MGIRIRIKQCGLVVLAAAALGFAQKPPQRPKVHSDFTFNAYPPAREAVRLLSDDKSRFMLVAFHEGWDFEKVGKELKLSDDEVDKLYSDLDAEHLAVLTQDGDPRPAIPVIREKEIFAIRAGLDKHSQEFAKLVEDNWPQIESMATSLTGAKGVPKESLMYQVVASSILLGAMNEALYEDKTIVPPGPKRGRGQNYYGWLVEGDPKYAGRIQREEGQADGYTIVSIGYALPMVRPGLEEIRASHGMILDEAESRRLRSFSLIFSKDKLMPYLKENRNDMLKIAAKMNSSRYSGAGEFLAWYYNQMVNIAVNEIIASRRMAPPVPPYAYAVRTLR